MTGIVTDRLGPAPGNLVASLNLHGNVRGNVLWGNKYGSQLQGYEGNDILYGAGGRDTLEGGFGNDIYRFDRDSGADVIIEWDSTAGNRDTLFIDGKSDQLWFRRVGLDLKIDIMGTQDANGANPSNSVTIQNYFGGFVAEVERIVSSDGKSLGRSGIAAVVGALASEIETYGATTLAGAVGGSVVGTVNAAWTVDDTVAKLIGAMAQFAPAAAGTTLTAADYQNRMNAVYAANVMI